jgi:hypothetical protein
MEIEKLPNAHIKNYIQGACDKTNRESKKNSGFSYF